MSGVRLRVARPAGGVARNVWATPMLIHVAVANSARSQEDEL